MVDGVPCQLANHSPENSLMPWTIKGRSLIDNTPLQVGTTDETPLPAFIAQLVNLVLARMVGEVLEEIVTPGRVKVVYLDTVSLEISQTTAVEIVTDGSEPHTLQCLGNRVERLGALDRVWRIDNLKSNQSGQ